MNRLRDHKKILDNLRSQDPFQEFSDQEFAHLAEHMRIKEYNKGQILADQGDKKDYFFFLSSGVIRTERYDYEGENTYYEYIRPNMGLPYAGLFISKTYTYSIVTLTPVTVIVFPMSIFESVVVNNNRAMLTVIKKMSEIIDYNEYTMQMMINSSATVRVSHALSILAHSLGTKKSDGSIYISYPITLIELAEVSSTTRETAATVVNNLFLDNDLVYSHKHFTIFENFLDASTFGVN